VAKKSDVNIKASSRRRWSDYDTHKVDNPCPEPYLGDVITKCRASVVWHANLIRSSRWFPWHQPGRCASEEPANKPSTQTPI
jgi:hypothetical protein